MAEWDDGWWRDATRVPSPNFSARPAGARVDTVVLHSISLPPGEYGGDGIPRLFTNTLDWSAHPYFESIRKARAAVKIPAEYLNLSDPKTVTPSEVEDAFVKVNPGLSNAAISITCNRNRLSEVRICLSKDLQFRACEELDRRGCRRDQVTMPPVRGG